MGSGYMSVESLKIREGLGNMHMKYVHDDVEMKVRQHMYTVTLIVSFGERDVRSVEIM